MSRPERWIVIAGLTLFVASCLYPPFMMRNFSIWKLLAESKWDAEIERPPTQKYDFLLIHTKHSQFRYIYKIDTNQLFIEWALIAITTIVLAWLIRQGGGRQRCERGLVEKDSRSPPARGQPARE